MEEQNSLGTRIAELRTALKLSRPAFGEKLGVAGTRIQDIERGRQRPPMDLLAAIQDLFKPNPKWLLRNEGQMFEEGLAEPMPQDQWMTMAMGKSRPQRDAAFGDVSEKLQRAYALVNQALHAVEFVPTVLQREALRTVAFADGVPIDRLILLIEGMRENRS